jgi:hypothetical protein
MKNRWMVLCLCVAGVVGAQGADKDFEAIVHRLEAHYGTKRLHIPMMGVANFFVKVSRPEGVSDLKMAVFEDLDESRHPSPEALEQMFGSLATEGWRPFVRVQSNKDGERVEIFSRASGKRWELLLTTLQRNEATVIQMRLSPDALAQWIADPEGMAVKKER